MVNYPQSLIDANNSAEDSLGVRLGRACINFGYSINDVAHELNTSKLTIYDWFTGNDIPNSKYEASIIRLINKLSGQIKRDIPINLGGDLHMESDSTQDAEISWLPELVLNFINENNLSPKVEDENLVKLLLIIKKSKKIKMSELIEILEVYDIQASDLKVLVDIDLKLKTIEQTDYSAGSFKDLASDLKKRKVLKAVINFWQHSESKALDAVVRGTLKQLEVKLLNAAMHGKKEFACILLPPNQLKLQAEDYDIFSIKILDAINKSWSFSESKSTLSISVLGNMLNFDRFIDDETDFDEIKDELLKIPALDGLHETLFDEDNHFLLGLKYEQFKCLKYVNFDMSTSQSWEEEGYHINDKEKFNRDLLYWLNDIDGQKVIQTIFGSMLEAQEIGEKEVRHLIIEAGPLLLNQSTYDDIDEEDLPDLDEYKQLIDHYSEEAKNIIDISYFAKESYILFGLEIPLKASHARHIFELLNYETAIKCDTPYKGVHELIIKIPS